MLCAYGTRRSWQEGSQSEHSGVCVWACSSDCAAGESISQEALAAEGGYHRTYIDQIERGEKNPSIRTVFDLCKVLRLKASALIADAEDALSA
jgi:DNA-binding XRE family transcriptional regulator